MRCFSFLCLVLLSCFLDDNDVSVGGVHNGDVIDTIILADTLNQLDTILEKGSLPDGTSNSLMQRYTHTYQCDDCVYEANELRDTLNHHIVLDTECNILNKQEYSAANLPQSFEAHFPIITLTYNHAWTNFICGGSTPLLDSQ